jgi:hypothetical protein
MSRAVSVRTTRLPIWCFVSFLGAVLLTISANAAAAQSWADSTRYAEIWTPTNSRYALHLHGGLFSRVDISAPSPTVGLRLSKLIGSHLQAGFLTGWTLERKDETQGVSALPGPEPKILLARVDAHLIPVMAFLRVNMTETRRLVPYFGVGVGYEWLMLKATDFRTQTVDTATFSNWAWEGWGGLGMRLGTQLRLNGEAFYNGATLKRDVTDQNGLIWKELVNLDGVGLRLGLDIIFD